MFLTALNLYQYTRKRRGDMENTFGKNTKKLGFGMMRLPEQAASGKFGRIDIELTRKMVDSLPRETPESIM